MAELLGLVASVIQVAGAGVQLSKTLYDYVDGVATADRRIKDIASEIKMTSIVIEELGDVFKHEETASLVSKKAVKTANDTITECSTLFAQIDATLKKSKKSTFGRLTLPFRDTKLELLRSHVDKLKSTLQLLMQVLTHAYQVASRKLDRAAEERQPVEIKRLLEKKDLSAKKHEELLRKNSTSSDSTLIDDDELGGQIGQTAVPDTVVAASTINSTITAQSLATCVDHVRNLLRHIETLQEALVTTAPGEDHSGQHQNLVDSYFQTRDHLDQVVLGSSKHKLSPSTANPGGVGNCSHITKREQSENENRTAKESKEEEMLAKAKQLDMRSATKQESQANREDRPYPRSDNVIKPEMIASDRRERLVLGVRNSSPEITEREKDRQRRREEQRHREYVLDREVASNLTREENTTVHFDTSHAQAGAEQRADEMIVRRADELERLHQQEQEERRVFAASIPAARDDTAKRAKAITSVSHGPLNDRRHPDLPSDGFRSRPRLHGQYFPKSYTTREYMPSKKRGADTAVDELLKEWTTILE
ncbi:hypothetical protein EKO04_008472 [Ascochyta lentis]|uniref:Azaphilone pigments biosynthesis cluster protein L N-terminal domain-containing protein n=1 Tax=Ascochyta lentis TaxID=205686 RepID=A0A8H7IZJ1_9PLEO|nr:hypothetical protein EKO04_008472 [Ascochyta lentis]